MNSTRLIVVILAIIALLGTACNKTADPIRTPKSVVLLSPVNGANNLPDTLTLSVDRYTDAMHYYFFVTNVATLQTTQYTTDTPALYVALQGAQTYNWQVSVLTTDSTSASSQTWSFNTR